jgi:DNA-binding Lrp family transcriptional regulator
MKDVDRKILAELMKNAKISDRQLSKTIGVSQPTVTRRRARLEKTLIAAYTTIPNWSQLGFELMALTFIKGRDRLIDPSEVERSRAEAEEWLAKEANVVFAAAGAGLGWQGIIISYHKKYSTLASLTRRLRVELSKYIGDIATFVVDLNPGVISKPFRFEYLSKVE